MIIMRNYLMAAHLEELEEAALVDGAGYPYILFRIMVPLSKPLLATVALWVAVAHWNEWFYARIYLSGNRFLVLQSLLQRLIEHYRQDEQVLNDYVLQTETEINSANVVAATMNSHDRSYRPAVPVLAEILRKGGDDRVLEGMSLPPAACARRRADSCR